MRRGRYGGRVGVAGRPGVLLASVAPVLLALWGRGNYGALPALPVGRVDGPLPTLSIVVPARNEAHNLGRLLTSLTALDYPGRVEIIVVDDNSRDGTEAVAEGFGVCVLRVEEVPAGWLGKPRACHEGARLARGEWLLFTDADTEHAPGGPAAAVAYAQEKGLDGLSLFLRQETAGPVDGLALLAAFTGFFVGLQRPEGILNGQYVLLRREVYRQVGGHAAVRGETMEDLALGRRLREGGFHVPILRGESAAAVRMYPHPGQLWQGLKRWGAGSLRWYGGGALLTALFITLAVRPVLLLVGVLCGRGWLRRAVMAWAAVAAAFVPWVERPGQALLAPFGAAFVLLATTWGLVGELLGRGVVWKERVVGGRSSENGSRQAAKPQRSPDVAMLE